jgi:serine/threonine protein phosphatase PrpC
MNVACDGLWDVMTNEEAIMFVHNKIKELEVTQASITPEIALTITKSLVEHALVLPKQQDNVSATIVFFTRK